MTSEAASSEVSEEERLVQDVASLTRVRNRLARSPDNQLPKILPALLPKLMARLANYSDVPLKNLKCQEFSSHAQDHICGTLAHALERVRGNAGLPVGDLMNALLPFVTSTKPVLSTWALIFLQGNVQRCTFETLPSSTMAMLIQCVDLLHMEIRDKPGKPTQARLTSASWLFLDGIVMSAGLKPLVDWDMDFYDERDLRWETQKSDSWDALVSANAVSAAAFNGAGVFHLLLDLLLFWPTESAVHSGISSHGESLLSHRSRIAPEEQQQQQQRRPQRGGARLVGNKWTEVAHIYLRHLKLIGLRYAIWPSNQGLFQGETADRALILSVLFSSHNSMHGRLASDFLNEYNSSNGLKNVEGSFELFSADCSLAVACSLLILITGDRNARPVLEAFEESHSTRLWEAILGQRPVEESTQRFPLPVGVAVRGVTFLLEHPLKWANTKDESKEYARLLIDLALLLANRPEGDSALRSTDERKQGKFCAVQLVKTIYNQLLSSAIIHHENADEWTRMIFEKCLDASIEVLTVVVEVGQSNVDRQRNPHAQMPLGVAAAFNHRNDLNRLLNTHRESQKRRKLGMDDAIQARQVAYELITGLVAYSLDREKGPFELPIFLLKCAIYEEEYMQHYVGKALDALLREYTRALDNDAATQSFEEKQFSSSSAFLQQQAVPLLPSLLDAVCSDSVPARTAAAKWISRLLQKIDSQAAYYLSSYLIDDADAQVSQMAKELMEDSKYSISDTVMEENSIIFVDSTDRDGIEHIETKLRSRIGALSQALGVSLESAEVILYDFGFSPQEAQAAYIIGPQATRDECGLVRQFAAIGSLVDPRDAPNERICGICYEDVTESDVLAMECGHEFCRKCWTSFLNAAADEGPLNFLNTRCPQHDCNSRVLAHHLQTMAPKLYPKWNKAFLDAFIELDPSFRFCPGPDCKFVGVLPTTDGRNQKTTCNHCDTSFCFQCGEAPHQPASCEDFNEWNKIVGTSNFWIKKYAKPCPGCQAPIEKSMGCNHMKCEKCKTQFCWLCLTKLRKYSEDHSCNRYDPTSNAQDDFERRTLFVADRYQAHDEAEKFAHDQYKSFQKKADKLVELFWFLNEDDEATLHDALETVMNARKFLKNSYIASFGLRNEAAKLGILESHQSALEMFTERLSQLTETNLQRCYLEKGEQGLTSHFRGLSFYRVSVENYMERFLATTL